MAVQDVGDLASRSGGPVVPALRRWVVTLAATAASLYALDAVAVAAGAAMVTSGLLQEQDAWVVLLFLGCSYLLWGVCLRVNLQANWALLQATGTSTNLLSKAAHDLVGARTSSVPARKFAAALGYVGTELAKEAPYYVGAVGAVLVTDTVSWNLALVFLGGANLGAAAYEYGLARSVRAFLGRRSRRSYASFEADWVPGEYLANYYRTVEPDELATIAFFVEAMKEAESGQPVLFFGVGPTLHHVFPAAGRASELHLGDYLAANLREIGRWLERDPQAHDWRPFVRHTLVCEGLAEPTEEDVRRREELVRAKSTRLLRVDARRADPLRGSGDARYATVVSAYCADSATDDLETWTIYMERIAGLVRPGGIFVTAALRRTSFYLVGGKTFPSADIGEDDLRRVLESCFGAGNATVEVRELGEQGPHGYGSILLARARRAGAAPGG